MKCRLCNNSIKKETDGCHHTIFFGFNLGSGIPFDSYHTTITKYYHKFSQEEIDLCKFCILENNENNHKKRSYYRYQDLLLVLFGFSFVILFPIIFFRYLPFILQLLFAIACLLSFSALLAVLIYHLKFPIFK